jgi:predicted MFS family arabinose efflux permease
MGLMSASLGAGGALGLPLSAVIAQRYDWHVLFWFATGVGVVVLIDVPRAGAARAVAHR